MTDSLHPLFRPERLAVIGASAKPEKMGFQIFRNIVDAGFSGELIPVNPKGETILGHASVTSIDQIPSGTDLAVVVIPATSVPSTIRQLGARQVRSAIVITGGFAESGSDGARLQEELARAAAESGIRLIGPNCQGVNYPSHGLCASWPLIKTRGAMAIASQSGTVGAALADWASEEGLGFSAFVSMGNRLDVDEADLIEFFAHDPNTKVITLYIEGVKDAKKFLAAVKACPKPIVIFKAGRTAQGRKAAESHTRSLAGKDEIYDAVFRQFGIRRAHSLEELYDVSKALAYVPKPAGPRMLIVTSSGGSAIIATDVAEENGYRVAPLPDPLASKLREILPAHCIVGNPLDLTGDTDAERYRRVLAVAREHYDVVTTIFGDPIPGASKVLEPGAHELVIYLGGADVERAERRLLHEKGIAVFPTPERGVAALARLGVMPSRGDGEASPAATHAPAMTLPPVESFAFLQREGIDVVRSKHAASEDAAVAAAREIGYPVVLKLNSLDITHKSRVGGVHLNLRSDEEVRAAYARIAAIDARHDGVLVSAMAAPGREVIVGVMRDLQFGRAVMFGIGGTLVEVLRDVAFRIVPFGEAEAAAMIEEIAGARLLRGLDKDALVQLIVRVAGLDVEEMDLNPVIVYEKGLTIVDARVVRPSAS